MLLPIRRIIASAMLLILAVGCGGPQASGGPGVPAMPACAQVGTPVALPPGFPQSVPMPAGTVITSVETRTEGRIVVNGVIPTDVKAAGAFFEQQLPAAGFKITDSEAESNESEGSFEGNGIKGRWRVRGMANCPGATDLALVVGQ